MRSRVGQSRAGAVLMALALLAVTACSSSSHKPPPTTAPPPPISKAALITKANAICVATEASLSKAEKAAEATGSASLDETVAFVTLHLIPATQAEVTKIRAIGTPIGDHGKLKAILDEMDKTLTQVLANPQEAIASASPFEAVDQQLQAYGLGSCRT